MLRLRYSAAFLFVAAIGSGAIADTTGDATSTQTTTQPASAVTVSPSIVLDPVTITATGSESTSFQTPYMIGIVDQQQLDRRQYRTTPQALRDIPGVMVQETGVGQGSPFIRGFTSNRTVLLIDGVRLNNSVFREGPNQYWGTVDSQSIQRFDVVKGPSSVLYGSDAIGGTVNAITKDPYAYGREHHVAGRGYYRYSSGEDSHIGRGEFSASLFDDSTGILIGGTLKEFGTMTGGRDVGSQPQTDYEEYDVDFKVEHFFNEDTRLVALHQRVRINNAPRTHRTVDAIVWEGTGPPTNRPRLREDFDQERELTYVQFHAENIGTWVDEIHASISHQHQGEVRDRIRTGPVSQDFVGFDVETLGVFANAVSPSPVGTWTYGFEYYRDWVNSFSSSNPIQGSVGDDANYDLLGVYVQNEYQWHERVKTIIGGRFTYARAEADSVSDGATPTPNQISVADDYTAFVGSGRVLVTAIPEHLNVFGGISQGFRAPNLMDLTSDLTFGAGVTQIGSPDLDPEDFISYEIGVKAKDENWQAEVAYFYTDIEDLIVRVPTADPDVQQVVNGGEGYINGIEAGAAWRFAPELTLFGNITWQEGEVERPTMLGGPLTEQYVSRLSPLQGQLGLRYEPNNLPIWLEGLIRAADEQDKLAPNDVSDNRIPPGGTPGYVVAAVRGGWEINPHWTVTAAVENLTDEDYRIHGSGQNMPGVNFIVGLEGRF